MEAEERTAECEAANAAALVVETAISGLAEVYSANFNENLRVFLLTEAEE
jgi:hypothetical protein